MTLSIATINVNGLRAAVRRGMDAWVAQVRPDVMALQEVRAPDEVVAPLLGDGWSHVGASSVLKGRAGVAVAALLTAPVPAPAAPAHVVGFAEGGTLLTKSPATLDRDFAAARRLHDAFPQM